MHHQREDIVAFVELRVVADLRDQSSDYLVVALAIGRQLPAGAPRAEGPAYDRRHHGQPRGVQHHRRQQLTQFVERGTLGTEHRPQDRVEGDAHHRRQSFELPALGPRRGLAQHLFFDDPFVGSHPLAVERRDEKLATFAVLGAIEAECRTGTEHLTEHARPGNEIGVGGEQILDQGRIADHDGLPEDRHAQREGRAVSPGQRGDRFLAGDDEAHALQELRYPRCWWHSHWVRGGHSHVLTSMVVLQGTGDGTPQYRTSQPPFPHASNSGTVGYPDWYRDVPGRLTKGNTDVARTDRRHPARSGNNRRPDRRGGIVRRRRRMPAAPGVPRQVGDRARSSRRSGRHLDLFRYPGIRSDSDMFT